MDKLASMRAFTRVVSHGSFSEAAREMRLSRSAVSKHVIDLEAELGVQLLNRTTRSASPTDNGRRYYERCLAILSEIDEADLEVSQGQAAPRGLLGVKDRAEALGMWRSRRVSSRMGPDRFAAVRQCVIVEGI